MIPHEEGLYTSYQPKLMPRPQRFGYAGGGKRSFDPQAGNPHFGNRSWHAQQERDAPTAPGYDRRTGAFTRLPAWCEFHLGESANGCQVCAAGQILGDMI